MMDDGVRPDLYEWMDHWTEEVIAATWHYATHRMGFDCRLISLCIAMGTSDCVAGATAERHAAGQGLVIINLQAHRWTRLDDKCLQLRKRTQAWERCNTTIERRHGVGTATQQLQVSNSQAEVNRSLVA